MRNLPRAACPTPPFSSMSRMRKSLPLIAEGKADIMITETMEARRYVRMNEKLAAPLVDKPFTRSRFGALMAKGDQDFLNYVNFFLAEMETDGTMDALEDTYIK